MKKTLLFLSFLFSLSTFGQLSIDSFYVDRSTYLIHSQVETFDSTFTSEKILQDVKNWAGVNFVNAEHVLVSETNNQLVFNYRTPFYHKGLGMKHGTDWYIRLIVQVKDGKSRFLFYDDGNTFIPYSGQGTRSIEARKYKIDEMYSRKGFFQKRAEEGSVDFKNSIKNSTSKLINAIRNRQAIKNSNDW